MEKSAVISECGLYRHILFRIWDRSLPLMGFIQLNPSIADAEKEDPTLRRDMYFAKREKCGGVALTNMYDFRATSPKDLEKSAAPKSDMCEEYIARMMNMCKIVVAGYGAHKMAIKGEQELFDLMDYRDKLYCLGRTKEGMPRHPLYVKNDQPLLLYAGPQ